MMSDSSMKHCRHQKLVAEAKIFKKWLLFTSKKFFLKVFVVRGYGGIDFLCLIYDCEGIGVYIESTTFGHIATPPPGAPIVVSKNPQPGR